MSRSPGLRDLESGLAALLPARVGSAYWKHSPTPKQREFIALEDREALYGGAAGGGKSDALLMDALQNVHLPGYAALILRRSYSDLALPGAIMDRAHDWLSGTPAKWDDETKSYRFPKGGKLCFGYLKVEKDKFRYASAEFQFIGFDELTQFPELWYTFLSSRLRQPSSGPLSKLHLKLRGATNPGGIGHEWVRERFVEAGSGRPFIPSKMTDNPHLNEDTYRESLSVLDEHTKNQLEHGVWVSDQSNIVFQYDPVKNAATTGPIGKVRYVLGIDYGFNDACAFVELCWSGRVVYISRSYHATKMTPSDAAEFVQTWRNTRQYDRIVGDMNGLGKGYAAEARKRFGIPIEPAAKTDKLGYLKLFRGAMERGEIKVCGGNEPLIKEWGKLPWNDDRSDYHDGFQDHLSDAALYGWREAAAWATALPKEAAYETEESRFLREESDFERRTMAASRRDNSWAKKMMGRR
jgi:hypothetical protein